MIADEVFRGRFRNSFEKPEPITPGEITSFKIDLHTANHVFKKGHRIMVQVQSTWFPVIDRNPHEFVPKLFRRQENPLPEGHAAHLSLQEISLCRRNLRTSVPYFRFKLISV